MKKIFLFTTILFIISCTNPEYKYIGQEVIDGKVSAVQSGTAGRVTNRPSIWVQDATSTQEVSIPFEYSGRWKVGDSCLLIIEKYELVKEE